MGHKCSGSPALSLSRGIQCTKAGDLGVWMVLLSVPKEKALVPVRLMRADLLTEGPPLEKMLSCVRATPQRSHFL
ncbi:hypothetical protein CesoFtcFv8_004230 [Champsocephalus esox]|uniref:Uncharacterized protein n=2 Tax=Champsocephalus TaxID=52236 RepID=A0AAN8E7C8_CHAGU|nr:hypothetical protein CesoFtcFv8_004230 [Champsocephalus esox]KAK5932970.1 hypothetical protein CgunFtcFv8_004637 [Champsocephalus gunnari]